MRTQTQARTARLALPSLGFRFSKNFSFEFSFHIHGDRSGRGGGCRWDAFAFSSLPSRERSSEARVRVECAQVARTFHPHPPSGHPLPERERGKAKPSSKTRGQSIDPDRVLALSVFSMETNCDRSSHVTHDGPRWTEMTRDGPHFFGAACRPFAAPGCPRKTPDQLRLRQGFGGLNAPARPTRSRSSPQANRSPCRSDGARYRCSPAHPAADRGSDSPARLRPTWFILCALRVAEPYHTPNVTFLTTAL